MQDKALGAGFSAAEDDSDDAFTDRPEHQRYRITVLLLQADFRRHSCRMFGLGTISLSERIDVNQEGSEQKYA